MRILILLILTFSVVNAAELQARKHYHYHYHYNKYHRIKKPIPFPKEKPLIEVPAPTFEEIWNDRINHV